LLTSAAVLGTWKAKAYASAVIATLGYGSPADQDAAAPNVRFSRQRIFLNA
jgi:hypothetical protein